MDFKPGVYLSRADVAFRGSQIICRHRPVAADHDTVPRQFDNEDFAGACVLAKMFSCSCVINHILNDITAYLYAGRSCIKYNPFISRGKLGLAEKLTVHVDAAQNSLRDVRFA